MTSVCTHQLTRPARPASSSRKASRNVIISVAMKSAMTIDSTDTCVAERRRPDDRAPDEQAEDADEHRRPQTASSTSA